MESEQYVVVLFEDNEAFLSTTILGAFTNEESACNFILNNVIIPDREEDTWVEVKVRNQDPTVNLESNRYLFDIDSIEPSFTSIRCYITKDNPSIYHNADNEVVIYAQTPEEAIEIFSNWRTQHFLLGIKLTLKDNEYIWNLSAIYKEEKVQLGIGEPKNPLGRNFPVIKAYIPWDSNVEEVKEQMLLKLKEFEAGRFSF